MTSSEGHSPSTDTVMAEAVTWLGRLHSGAVTSRDAQALRQWRERSPAHEAAFQEIIYLRKLAPGLSRMPPEALAELKRLAARSKLHRRNLLTGAAAVAASIAGLAIVRPPLGLWPSLTELMADHRTVAGQHFAFDPAPGVKVEMNTRTSMSLGDQGNRIDIVDGESFINVSARAQTFVAAASGVEMATRAGSFNVKAYEGKVCVTCIAGRVAVKASETHYELGHDEQIIVSGNREIARTRVDAVRILAWRRGLLMFDNTPLSTVVSDVNRYLSGRIVLTNSAILSRPVNGVFHTSQIQNTIVQIQKLVGANLTQVGGVFFLS